MIERQPTRRRQLFAESRLVSEYLQDRYAGAQWFVNLRVGTDPELAGVNYEDDAQRALARNWLRRVDAVVVTETELVVIEATMYNADEKVGKLQGYMLLVPATPDLRPFLGRRLVGELVTAQDDPIAAVVARRAGMRYVFYEPAWIDEFWALYPLRRRRPPHAGTIEELARMGDESSSSAG